MTTMTDATFNFRLDTLLHEIEMHEHREELIQLMHDQQEDDRNFCNAWYITSSSKSKFLMIF